VLIALPSNSSSTRRQSPTSQRHVSATKRCHSPEYDLAGRTIKSTNNWTDGTPGGGTNNDQDQVAEYEYSVGLMARTTEKMASSADDIVTQYVFGTDKGADGNAISTGHLLYKTHHPAQTSGQTLVHRTALQSYNALGEVIRSTDPAGNRIDTTYSTAGRVVLRDVHTFASGFDTTVKSIETSYDGMGRLSLLPAPSSSCLRVFVPIPSPPLPRPSVPPCLRGDAPRLGPRRRILADFCGGS
jgi:YD repeat-containing protein